MTREPVELEVFLKDLEQEAAGAARVAAREMDELERTIDDVRDIEARYWGVAMLAAVAFVFGAIVVLYPSDYTRPIFETLGPLPLTAMIVSLGLVGLVYGYAVRRRSQVDDVKQALNREHFVPHDAYYFPPETRDAKGRVIFFKPRKLKAVRAGPHDNVRPGTSWW